MPPHQRPDRRKWPRGTLAGTATWLSKHCNLGYYLLVRNVFAGGVLLTGPPGAPDATPPAATRVTVLLTPPRPRLPGLPSCCASLASTKCG